MATRNQVPRANGEGSVGTSAKRWLSGYFGTLYASAISGLATALSVSQGGTGATDAATARSNLGAAPAANPTLTGTVTATDVLVKNVLGFQYGESDIGPYNKIYGAGANPLTIESKCTGSSGASVIKLKTYNGDALVVDANREVYFPAGQLKFPATQNPSSDPNTLDDYEEGTWTPVIGGASGAAGQSYSSRFGCYVKIGSCVIAEFSAALSAKGTLSGSNYFCITGLPFSIGAGGDSGTISFISNCGAVNSPSLISSSANYFSLYTTLNGVTEVMLGTAITDTSTLYGIISYQV